MRNNNPKFNCQAHLSVFGHKLLQSGASLQAIANSCVDGSAKSRDAFDFFFLETGMIQWLRMIQRWQELRVAWAPRHKVNAAVRWHLLGQHVGETPIYENICAYCGNLLFGALNSTEFGDKRSGKPVNIDGKFCNERGTPISRDAQPPFLLRWSPDFFAQVAPNVFTYDPRSNKVGLQDDHRASPPWIRTDHPRNKEPEDCWLYCSACHEHLTNAGGDDIKHVPFRDQHSLQQMIHGPPQAEAPPHEPEEAIGWRERLQHYSRKPGGRFTPNNLVPKPDPKRWQNVPHVPFDKLQTNAAVSRLSLCKLDNCMQ